MQTRPLVSLLALAAATAVLLTGCASGAGGSGADDGELRVVASTNVYGDIATTVAGDAARVTSIMDDPAQDPHSFEASAQNQLAISKADVVVENGGGYDDFMDTMLKAAPNSDREVLNVVDLSGKKAAAGEELNEHVWYDLPTVRKLAGSLADALGKADPARAATFSENAEALSTKISALEDRIASLRQQHAGEGAAVTEPVPLYLLEAMGLENKTPHAFSEAIEEGTDVSPAVLQSMLDLLKDGSVKLLVYNEQTAGPETQRALAAAKTADVPVVPVTETLPGGKHYVSWMTANVDAVEEALAR